MSSPAPERDEPSEHDEHDEHDERDGASGFPEIDELWSWGATTSRAMAERVSDMYRGLGAAAFRLAPPELDAELGQLRVDVDRLAELSFDVFDRLLTIVGSIADGADRRPRAREEVRLRATEGETASAEVWVHNVSVDAHAAPHLHLPGLTSADGTRIPAEGIHLTSADTAIDAGNSRRFTLAVEIPSGTPGGAYHGVLISDASIDTVMLVRLDVGPPDASPADGA